MTIQMNLTLAGNGQDICEDLSYLIGMGPDLNFWIVAWLMMGLAFLTAFLGILLGARGLDKVGTAEDVAENDSIETE